MRTQIDVPCFVWTVVIHRGRSWSFKREGLIVSQMLSSGTVAQLLMAVSTESFLSQSIHLLFQLIAPSLSRALLSLIPRDMASPEMSAWDPSLYSWLCTVHLVGDCFLSLLFCFAFCAASSAASIYSSAASSRHIHAQSCWLELQNGKWSWYLHFLGLFSFFASEALEWTCCESHFIHKKLFPHGVLWSFHRGVWVSSRGITEARWWLFPESGSEDAER